MSDCSTIVETLRQRAEGTNVNPKSLLATDYLNHFNEALMLLEMVPDMPDMLEEVMEWRPKAYQDHFRQSGFSDKELAIEAYRWAPAKFRKPFDKTVAEVDAMIIALRDELAAKLGFAGAAMLRDMVAWQCELIRGRMDVASSIIHGNAVCGELTYADETVEKVGKAVGEESGKADETLDQSAIDSLFD